MPRCLILLLPLLLLCLLQDVPSSSLRPAQVSERYREMPKGVTLEQPARGIEPVQTLSYHPDSASFVINDDAIYAPALPRDMLLDLVNALRNDPLLGVSIRLDDRVVVFGELNKRGKVAAVLAETDNFLRGVILGNMDLLQGTELPGAYKPVAAQRRTTGSLIYLNLTDYVFTSIDGEYQPIDYTAELLLVPMADHRAPDGGYLPDYDALERGEFQPEDKGNYDHMMANKNDYLALPTIQQSIRLGQVASFLRYLQTQGIDMTSLANAIRRNTPATLDGSATAEEVAAYAPPAQPKQIGTDAIPAQTAASGGDVYADAIRNVFALDTRFGSTNRVAMDRATINDGSYVAFRKQYLKKIDGIDLSICPEDFAVAFEAHRQAWRDAVAWLTGKTIAPGGDAFAEFKEEFAPYQRRLSETFAESKDIAQTYGVVME